MNRKIKIKDLVLTGAFGVLYFVAMFALGMIGIVPILYLAFPFVNGVVGGIITFLFMAKVQKPFLTGVLGLLPGIFMQVSGYPIAGLIYTIVIMIIVEVLRYIGKYNSFKMNMIANGVFNLNLCSSFIIMCYYKEEVRHLVEMSMGKEYTEKIYALINTNSLIVIFITAFIGGIIGAFIAKKLLKKHFEKAGII